MRNLLSANMLRLRKSHIFRLCAAVIVLLVIFSCLNQYHMKLAYNAQVSLDKLFFSCALICSFASAIFSALFVGTEYSAGTIRNKLIVGHRRIQVYFSNFITCSVAGLVFNLAFSIPLLLLGIPMFGFFKSPASLILICILITILSTICLCAIFTLLSMLISNRAFSVVLCIVFLGAMLLAATVFLSRLQEPEFTSGYSISVDGVLAPTDPEPNYLYVTGVKRQVFQFMLDFLPAGQILSLWDMSIVHPWQMVLYSLAVTIAVTALGVAVFRKKDLK